MSKSSIPYPSSVARRLSPACTGPAPAGEEQVAHAQCHVLRHGGDEPVHREEQLPHVARLAALSVHVESEAEPCDVASRLREPDEPRREGYRVVERLRALPRQPFGGGLPLQVAGREVDAHPHFVVITVREPFGDGPSDAADAHDQPAGGMHLPREAGNVERVVVAQHRRIGFEKPDGFRPGFRSVAAVRRVVALYADDLHRFRSLWS